MGFFIAAIVVQNCTDGEFPGRDTDCKPFAFDCGCEIHHHSARFTIGTTGIRYWPCPDAENSSGKIINVSETLSSKTSTRQIASMMPNQVMLRQLNGIWTKSR
jgi:hypothetical protein